MTLFPKGGPEADDIPDARKIVERSTLDADCDFIIETTRRARAQGRAEGMEEAAKIADLHKWFNNVVATAIAAAIREAAKTKGP